jgi:hypothetical protein
VTAAIEPLNTAAATLKEAAAPLKVGITSAAGGAPVQFETAQLTALEKAQDEAEAALSNVKAKVKTLLERQGRLEAKMKEAEAKVPKAATP